MLTPAQAHFQRVMSERRGRRSESPAARTAYEQNLHRLRMDLADLSGIQSMQVRAEHKRRMLPNYKPWVDGVLAADTGQADEVVTTVMIWSIDAGEIAEALRVAEYVLRHKLPLPDQYKRNAATVLVEEICNPVLSAFKADPDNASLSADLLIALRGLTAGEDMPDPVRAKLCKALAFTLRLSGQPEDKAQAVVLLKEATTLDQKVGVKRDIENLNRQLKGAAMPEVDDETKTAAPAATGKAAKKTTNRAGGKKAAAK